MWTIFPPPFFPHVSLASDTQVPGALDKRARECFFSVFLFFFSPCLDSDVHDRIRDVAALARSVIAIPTACCIIDLCARAEGGVSGVRWVNG